MRVFWISIVIVLAAFSAYYFYAYYQSQYHYAPNEG